MEQTFTKLDDGKIKWEYSREEKEHSDKEFGRVGTAGGYDFIIFDSYEQAKSILYRDLAEVVKFVEQYESEMEKNQHNLDTFTDIKDLVDSVGKLHNDFKECTADKIYALYKDDPKRYQKVLSEFNKAKEYIVTEMDIVNKEYGKYLAYQTAEKNLKFNQDQYDKIVEQISKLENVN